MTKTTTTRGNVFLTKTTHQGYRILCNADCPENYDLPRPDQLLTGGYEDAKSRAAKARKTARAQGIRLMTAVVDNRTGQLVG